MSCNNSKLAAEHARLQRAKAGALAGSAPAYLSHVLRMLLLLYSAFVLMLAAEAAMPRLFPTAVVWLPLPETFRGGKRQRRKQKISRYAPVQLFISSLFQYHLRYPYNHVWRRNALPGGQTHPISIKDMLPDGCHAAALNEGQQPH